MNPPADTLAFNPWTEVSLRFRFAGILTLIVAIAGWLCWFSPFDDLLDRSGTPLGGDFVMLYVAGQAVAQNEAHTLYDDRYNQLRSNALFPKMEPTLSWPYRYPPTVAAVMAPISRLPFSVAWTVFLAVQIALLLLSLRWMWKLLSILQQQSNWMWGIIGAPVIAETIVGGQSSLIALACVMGTAYFLKHKNFAIAGIMLALAMYKPNVLALFVLGCVIVYPKTLRGFVPTMAIGILTAIGCCGVDSLRQYMLLTLELASTTWSLETPFDKVHGLAPYFQACFTSHGKLICLLCGLIFSVVIAMQWRRGEFDDFYAMSLLLANNSLFNPYVPIYDLVLLVPALAFAGQSLTINATSLRQSVARGNYPPMISARDFQWIAGILFFGPHLSQSLASVLGFQLFPTLVVAIIGMLLISRGERCAAKINAQWKHRESPNTNVECHR